MFLRSSLVRAFYVVLRRLHKLISKKKKNMGIYKGSSRPEGVVRQHTYVYIALILFTALLIYYYSIPLEISFTSIKPASDTIESTAVLLNEHSFRVDENYRTKLFRSTFTKSTVATSSKPNIHSLPLNAKYGEFRSKWNKLSNPKVYDKIQNAYLHATTTIDKQSIAIPVVLNDSTSAHGVAEERNAVEILAKKTHVAEILAEETNEVDNLAQESNAAHIVAEETHSAQTIAETDASQNDAEETNAVDILAEVTNVADILAEETNVADILAEETNEADILAEEANEADNLAQDSNAAHIVAEETHSAQTVSDTTNNTQAVVEGTNSDQVVAKQKNTTYILDEETNEDQIVTKKTNVTEIVANVSTTDFHTRKSNINSHSLNISTISDALFQKVTASEQNISSKSMDVKESINQNEFIVFSKHCKIPNIDPMHPSILPLVKLSPPLVCKDKDPLTITEGNMLFIDKAAVESRGFGQTELFCCYRPLYRDKEGFSDNKIAYGNCHQFRDKAKIRDEFIQVLCSYPNRTTIYEEYHSFIHDKPHVEKRCSKHNDSKYSVLIIGIDSMSRLNMHRQLQNTSRYLLKNMEAIEMYGFNKVADNTFPNLIPLLLGYDERELPQVCYNFSVFESLDKCNFIWKRYADKGYRTLYAEDTPGISTFNYVKRGFNFQPTDYYFRHFILPYEKALGRKLTTNCFTCVGSVSETEAVLHWAELFASNFGDRPYFAFSWINSLTHDYMNLASAGDHMYEHFFRTLHQSGALNKTIVVVLGDHGMRWGPIRETFVGRLEERLPMLVIALPPEFRREYPHEAKALKLNSHRLVTPFDLHATLVNILHLKENWTFSNPDNVGPELANNFTNRAQSLFQPVPEDRSCDDASIEEHWCTCEGSLPMDTDTDEVKIVAHFLVKKLNALLKPVRKICARLKLRTISDARVWTPSSEHQGHSEYDSILTVIVHTKPGGGIFEGTVRISDYEDYELLGTVSRLSLYGNQSACVQDAVLRKYCYCL